MFHHIVTRDLELKLLEPSDAAALFALTDDSRDFLRPWLPWVDSTKTVHDSQAFIVSTLEQFAANNGIQAAIISKGRMAGVIGFHAIDWANRRTSIGYWLGEKFSGRGIMSAACRAMVDIGFRENGLNRVEIRAAVGNVKSRAIPERLGFHCEGIARQAEWLDDHFVDHAVYAMLAEEWECQSRK